MVIVGPPSPAGTTADITNYDRATSRRLTASSHSPGSRNLGGLSKAGRDDRRTGPRTELEVGDFTARHAPSALRSRFMKPG